MLCRENLVAFQHGEWARSWWLLSFDLPSIRVGASAWLGVTVIHANAGPHQRVLGTEAGAMSARPGVKLVHCTWVFEERPEGKWVRTRDRRRTDGDLVSSR